MLFCFYWLLMTCGNKNWWQSDSLTLTHTLAVHTISDLCIATRWQHVANTKCCCTDWNAAVAGRHGFRWCCCCCWCLISTRWSIGHMEKYFVQRDCQMLISWKSGARLKRSASAIWNWLGQRKEMQEERRQLAAQLALSDRDCIMTVTGR